MPPVFTTLPHPEPTRDGYLMAQLRARFNPLFALPQPGGCWSLAPSCYAPRQSFS
jgi:hypothetical protein